MRRWGRRLSTALLLFFCLSLASAEPYRFAERVKQWRFDNGFTVLFLPREGPAFFSGVIYVDVGSVDEPVGQSGIAHLLEHMAFKGTPWIGTRDWNSERKVLIEIEKVAHDLRRQQTAAVDSADTASLHKRLSQLLDEAKQYVVPNEYDRLVTLAGGQQVNATTSADCTNYFMTLPSNQLELWALLESQRLAYPAWREFYKERDVVAEERRMRMEDDPEGRLYEEFISMALKAHPYRIPVIGWMSDILNLTATDVGTFYRQWYVPENMVAVIVGNISEEEARLVTGRYFGTLPARKSPSRQPTQEPQQKGERRVQLVLDAQPQLVLGWHKPPLPTHDAVIFDVLQYILSDNGRSSRLYSELVKKRGLCESVATFTAPGEKYPNLLCIWATPRAPHSPSEVESAVWDVLHELERDGVTSEELEMSVAKAESSIVRDLDSDLGCAKRIGYLYLITRDPAYLDKYLMALKSVTVSDIQRVVHDYLRRDNVTVATIDKGVVGHDATAQDRSTRGGKKSLGGPAMLNHSGGRRR